MDLHPDFKELLAELVAEKVELVVIGGYAVGRHAKPRATKDLVRYARDPRTNDATIARAVFTRIGDLDVPVIALDDLIANKRASGRPQDLADLALLERVRARDWP